MKKYHANKADTVCARVPFARQGHNSLKKLVLGVSLGAISSVTAPAAFAQSSTNSRALDEIIVTATRRAEGLQDVAISVEAMSGEDLEKLGVSNFEDYVSLLPGVNSTGQAPGKQEIFVRGVTPGRSNVRVAALGSEPSVSTFLNETPISTAGRNVDLYAADLNRIEVLKGPQGTLFGASSQAGTLRLITNAPELDAFHAGGKFDVSTTKGGENSHATEVYVNIPIVEDKVGLRVVAYNAVQGGYIDNVPGTAQLALTNPALFRAGGASSVVPNSRGSITNTDVVEDDFNDASYRGFRVTGLWEINEDWDLTAQYVNQSLETEGVFEFNPELSTDDDLNVRTFNPDYGNDDFDFGSYTLNGRLAGLDLVYNGSYSERTFNGQVDYTGYANVGPFIPYYICTYPGYAECGSPDLTATSFFTTDRLTQELRLSTDESKRWRAIAGVFYDDFKTTERTNFIYAASADVGFFPNFPIPGAFASDPSVRPVGTTFFNDFVRDREEFSVFGEFAFDVTEDITVTLGARNYNNKINLRGQSSFGQRAEGPAAAGGLDVSRSLAGQAPTTLSDTILKANVSWDVTDNVMLYGTYSEGYRSGGFNRNGGLGPVGNTIPFFFETDTVNNYEFGWKTTLFDGTMRFNGAAYFIDFADMQQGVLDFSITNTAFFDNVGEAEIKGLEFNTEWAATENLTVFASYTYTDSELTFLPDTIVNIDPVGATLPFAPTHEGVIGGRYERELSNDYTFSAQGVAKYIDDRFTNLVTADRFVVEGYTEVGLSTGISKDNWAATLYIDNATDSLGIVTAGSPDNIFRAVPIRPRTIGARFSFDY